MGWRLASRAICPVIAPKRPLDRNRNSKVMKASSSGRGDWACPKERQSTHTVLVVMIEDWCGSSLTCTVCDNGYMKPTDPSFIALLPHRSSL
ncbi:hypothetical protein TNCV_3236881 [Trichonephila clavipes]|nr:hypothetical protein TNCV_3236881 [Trichonephila clavipes]